MDALAIRTHWKNGRNYRPVAIRALWSHGCLHRAGMVALMRW